MEIPTTLKKKTKKNNKKKNNKQTKNKKQKKKKKHLNNWYFDKKSIFNVKHTIPSFMYVCALVYFFIFILFRIDIPFRKQWRPWSDAEFCGVWSGSELFV